MRSIAPLLLLAIVGSPAVASATTIVHHTVHASLDVPGHRVDAVDVVRLDPPPAPGEDWYFVLNENLNVGSVRAGDQSLEFEAGDGWDPRRYWKRPPYSELDGFGLVREVRVTAPASGWGAPPLDVEIRYSGVIADSLHSPERAYGRSFQTTSGRIVEPGAFLSGSTFWIPWSGEGLFSFDVTIECPVGWRAISQGAAAPVEAAAPGRSTDRWVCPHPMDEIYLIAGPYEVRGRDHGSIRLETWTYAETPEEMCTPYLEKAADTLDRYEELLGPYPFAKFALVENYWQTGYGMPSFTFLGDRVIRLPFIVDTSYPHEILHNWWGNCVYVEGGNWAEGLTTYGADYATKEEEGGTAARDYRRDALIGYRDFAMQGGKDFPLERFRERDSAATQAVGYGKTLMVFHMLRRRVGDEAFGVALRRFYAENRFRAATWNDVARAFIAESGDELGAWFEQWTRRPGAIGLSLADVTSDVGSDGGHSTVRGTLVQSSPPYDARIPVIAEGAGGALAAFVVESDREHTPFELPLGFVAKRVSVDPGFDLFRTLHTEEVAPVLAGVLGAAQTRIVIGDRCRDDLREALRTLGDGWAEDSTVTVVEETDLDPAFRGGTWFFGEGEAARAFRATLASVPGEGALVAAGRLDGDPDRPAALLWPAEASAVAAIGRKVPHYSKYSYLRFEGDRNVGKGVWDAGDSPLVVRFEGTPNEPEGSR